MSKITCFCYKSTILYTKLRFKEFKYFDRYFYKHLEAYNKFKSLFKFINLYFKPRNSVLIYYGTSGVPLGYITTSYANNGTVINYTLSTFTDYYRFDELVSILLFIGLEYSTYSSVNIYTKNENCLLSCLSLGMSDSNTDTGDYCYIFKKDYNHFNVTYETN